MKKTFLVLICFCFIFTGCKGYNKGPDVTVVTSGLSFVAKLSYMKNIYDYSVIIDKNGKTTINYISKSDEPGTDYIFEDDTVIYSYNGLEYKTDISAIPDNSIADFIYTVFKECKKVVILFLIVRCFLGVNISSATIPLNNTLSDTSTPPSARSLSIIGK